MGGVRWLCSPWHRLQSEFAIEKPTSRRPVQPNVERVGLIDNFYDHFDDALFNGDEHNIEIAFDEWASTKEEHRRLPPTFPQLGKIIDKGQRCGSAPGGIRPV